MAEKVFGAGAGRTLKKVKRDLEASLSRSLQFHISIDDDGFEIECDPHRGKKDHGPMTFVLPEVPKAIVADKALYQDLKNGKKVTLSKEMQNVFKLHTLYSDDVFQDVFFSWRLHIALIVAF